MFICALFALALIAAPTAMAADGPGGVAYDEPPAAPPAAPGATGATDLQPTVPGVEAKIVNGLAAAPAAAPDAVKQAIWAANGIGGNLLDSPLDSSSFLHWGASGAGDWITVYTNPGHAYAVIAGLRLDTSAAGDPSGLKGPRWRPTLRSSRGFKARHPVGL
jgi:hypothetical protein